jgi:translation elongation factor EF-Ts
LAGLDPLIPYTQPQAIKEVSAAVGEKISVRRFCKFQLGEGIEKKQV